jgi:topoisomerase-4 subunit A
MTDQTNIKLVSFKDALSERYLSYALSTIMARSLPDVRDGLKPVHRRILFAMRQLKLDPKGSPKKSARIIGDVMGKFHPHGELAIYNTLVRLAQDFTIRYPLIHGQGNFGNIDGDNAAAMRYTEAKLTAVAESMMVGLDEDAVPMKPTYDGEFEEPLILPSAFPNLLANGSEGIAVGMATSIPPHNVDEICEALLQLLRKPSSTIEELVQSVQGPDFPTGGIIVEDQASILQSYKTGRGSFRVRAKYEVEESKGGHYQIVITEIPYQVQKSRLVEKLADLVLAKKLPILADIEDESTDDVRLVLTPKSRNVKPEVLMQALFKQTDLETRISLNMNVVDAHNIPRVMNLKEVLQSFLDHRLEVLKNRSAHRLERIKHRLEVLGGYLIAYLNLDEVIRIIREEDDAKQVMMKKWKLTEIQADAILNMRLRSLRKLEEIEIKQEHETLSAEKTELEALLKDDKLCWQKIKGEIRQIQEVFGKATKVGARRTQFEQIEEVADMPLEAMIEKEPITIILSKKGWIRAVKGYQDDQDFKFKEGDKVFQIIKAETTDQILFFADNGRFYTILGDKIPRGRGFGEPLRLLIDLENESNVINIIPAKSGSERQLLVAAEDGRGFLVKEKDVFAQTKNGKQILNVKAPAKAQAVVPAVGDHVAMIGKNRRLLVVPVSEIPAMTRGRGVILQKYRGGGLSDLKVFSMEEGLSWMNGKKQYNLDNVQEWVGKRASAGRFAPPGFPRSNRFS